MTTTFRQSGQSTSTNSTNLTNQEEKLLKLQNFRKEPLAGIHKPLRYLRDKLTETFQDAKGQWQMKLSAKYYEAAEAARNGDGEFVRRLALKTYHQIKRA